MANIINAITTGGGGISTTADASGSIQIATNNGTTAMTIDTSQNVGIGTTTPSGKFHVANGDIYITNGYSLKYSATSYITPEDNSIGARISAGTITMWSGSTPAERMRINSSGNVLIGTTSGGTYSDCRMTLSANSGTTKWDMGPYTATPTNFLISSGTGGVFLSGSATSWSALSDERQKTNLVPIADASNKLNTLRTVTGRYITDEETISRAFLIAQDVQKVLPEAVDAQEDEESTLGLRYTDLIPLLIAGFKEQQTIINELKTRIETLEAK